MKKYPFVKQEGLKDCGVASLSMIINFYKGYVPIEELRDMTKTTKKGVTAYHLVETAIELGFEANGVRANLNDLNKNNLILPCIAYVTIDDSYNHYIVIYEINYKKKEILIADPSSKIKKISFNEFNKIFNNILIIIYPIRKLPLYTKSITLSKFSLKLLKTHKNIFFKILILSIFMTISSIIGTFYFENMISSINNLNKSLLSLIFIIFIIIFIFKTITDYLRNKLLIIMNEKIELTLTNDIFSKVISLPYQYFKNRTTGEVISRINDLETVKEAISKVALTLIIDLSLTIFASIFLYLINKTLFIISIIILIMYIIIVVIFKDVFAKSIEDIQQEKSLLNSYMVESISGFETVKGLSIEKNLINKFKRTNVLLLNKIFKFENIYNLEYFLKEFINEIGEVIIIFVGCLLVFDNKISLGSLITFNSLLIYFMSPIRNVIDLNRNIKEASSSLKRINELVIKTEENKIIKDSKFQNIKINNLNYSHNDIDNILEDVNLNINHGEKIMIVGKSGSGKSTLLKILKGYYKIKNNKIFINDIDINNYSKQTINKNITYISQNEILFTDSLYNNLKLYRNINETKLIQISKMCYIDEIIENNNLGLNMLIEENGFNVSGGEKQRIVLARSLLNKFEVLILDESLSQVDLNLERKILKNIFNKYKDKIIIVVSHRYNNQDLFDKVVNIEAGKIKEVSQRNG